MKTLRQLRWRKETQDDRKTYRVAGTVDDVSCKGCGCKAKIVDRFEDGSYKYMPLIKTSEDGQ